MPQALVTVELVVDGMGLGSELARAQWATSQAAVSTETWGASFVTPTVPAGCTNVLILPPSGNTQTLTLKGVTGDTGLPLHKTQPSLLSLGDTAVWGILPGGSVSGVQLVWW